MTPAPTIREVVLDLIGDGLAILDIAFLLGLTEEGIRLALHSDQDV